jgi:LacI family transcriptional regulator
MSTIREVAEKAGVSFATVSHVINNTRFVSVETRERVLAAMSELNYRPNALAQSLRRGKTKTIGLILPDSSNPFFDEIGRSIEVEAFRLGYSVFLCNSERDAEKEELYVDVLSKKQVDGVIFISSIDRTDALELLLGQGMPVVIIDRDDRPDLNVDVVLVDNLEGGYLATRYLIGLGHRKIACVAGPSLVTPDVKRVFGYRDALSEAGIPFDENLVLLGDYHPESGQELSSLLLKRPDPPTALFMCNDLMAIGALRAAIQLGIRVPEDLSIVGFDDIELASYTNPALTTIAQPKAEVGSRAAQLLIEQISDRSRPCQRIVLPVRLVVRESSGPRNKQAEPAAWSRTGVTEAPQS